MAQDHVARTGHGGSSPLPGILLDAPGLRSRAASPVGFDPHIGQIVSRAGEGGMSLIPWSLGGQFKVRPLTLMLLLCHLAGGEAWAQFGPPQPRATSGDYSLGIGWQTVSSTWTPYDYDVDRNRVYLE